jgi:hypothetical protein
VTEEEIKLQIDAAVATAKAEFNQAVTRAETTVQSSWSRYWPWVIGVVALLALISLAANHWWPKKQADTKFGGTAPIPAVANVPVQELPPQRVIVLVKQEVVKKIKDLPDDVKNDPKKQITTTADIPPSPNGGSAIAYINTSSGVSNITYKAKPRPFMGLPNDVTVGVRYGVSTKAPSGQEGQVYGKWDFFRIGSAYLGAYGEVSTQPAAKAMVDLSMRW